MKPRLNPEDETAFHNVYITVLEMKIIIIIIIIIIIASDFREHPRRPSVRVLETENNTQSTFSVTDSVYDNWFDSDRGS